MQQFKYQVPKQVLLEFYNLKKEQAQLLYDILDYDLDSLYRVLNGVKNPDLIERLVDQLQVKQNLDDLVKMMRYGNIKELKNYLKNRITFQDLQQSLQLLDINEVQQKLQQEEVEERPIIQQNSRFLELPKVIIFHVMDFLEPESLHQIRSACLLLNELFCQTNVSDKFYAKFCQALFDQPFSELQQAPISPFEKVREYINHNLHLYEHHLQLINSINFDPSQTVWEIWGNPKQQILTYHEAKQLYSAHKEMYDKHLRINYCGIYAMKEYYVKYGEASFQQTSAPCFRVEYFRYLRFWRDGTFTMYITCKKLTKQQLIEYFRNPEYITVNKQQIQQKSGVLEDSFLRGEYRIAIDEVHAISARQSTSFYYVFKIKNYKNKHPGNVLLVKLGQMSAFGDVHKQDFVDTYKQNYFVYKHLEEFRQDLHEEQHGWKNVVY